MPRTELIITVQYYLLIVIIIILILRKKLNLTLKDSIVLFLLFSFILIIPSYRMIRSWYYQLKIVILLPIFILTISLLPIKLEYRLTLILTFIFLYSRNVNLLLGLIFATKKSLEYNIEQIKLKNLTRQNILSVYKNNGINVVFKEHVSKSPCIMIANYCSDRIENFLCIVFQRKTAIMMQEGFKKFNLDRILDRVIYVNGHGKGNYENIKDQVINSILQGYDIFVYANSPSYYNTVQTLSKGIFNIAVIAAIPIVPVFISPIKTKFGYIPNQSVYIKSGQAIIPKTVFQGQSHVRKYLNRYLRAE
jgi:hypothetical protein